MARYYGEQRRRVWWIAWGYGVSFMADLAGLAGYSDLAGNLYPLLQTGLIALAFLPVERVAHVVGGLGLIAASAVMLGAYAGHDLILATAASVLICVMALKVDRLRWSLWATFGVGGLAWIWYCRDAGWPSWGAYQGCRLLGAGAFCWAVSRPEAA